MNLSTDIEDRRAILRILLVITLLSAVFFSVFNWMVGLKLFALLEITVACVWGGIFIVSATTQNLQRWSLIYLTTFLCLVLVGIWLSKFRSGLYVWIFIFPIFSYLLLGRRLGFVLSAVSIALGLGALGIRVWQQDTDVHWIILGNFALCALAIWVMAHVYESRREAMVYRLQDMATRDPLTGLLNRRTLIETLDHVLYRAKRRSEPVTIVYIDINDFKLINDTQGHERGDHILRTVTQAISHGTRLEDYAFRLGGDEFLIVFTNCTESQAKGIYERRIASEFQKLEENLSLSIGYLETDPNAELTSEALIHLADQSMYTAKRAEKLKNTT